MKEMSFFEKVTGWLSIGRKYKKLLKMAIFEPGPVIDNYLFDWEKYILGSGWNSPFHPSASTPIESLARGIRRNVITKRLKEIKKTKSPTEKFIQLHSLVIDSRVTKDIVSYETMSTVWNSIMHQLISRGYYVTLFLWLLTRKVEEIENKINSFQ